MPDVDNTEEFRCISLCTGYAGIELGLRRVIPALRTVCYVEVEAFACANLVEKIEKGLLDAAPIWTDIKTFDGRPFYKRVHIITAGYPCQPFSVAARRYRKEQDDRNIWLFIKNIIREIRPLLFFGENVAGHLSKGFDRVVSDLDEIGYGIEAGLFSAAEIGAPHIRQRLFILAYSMRELLPRLKVQFERMGQGPKKTSLEPLLLPNWPARPIAQSKIPRAVDGSPCPVDRIRLLGNGVVPLQAEKAFRELIGVK